MNDKQMASVNFYGVEIEYDPTQEMGYFQPSGGCAMNPLEPTIYTYMVLKPTDLKEQRVEKGEPKESLLRSLNDASHQQELIINDKSISRTPEQEKAVRNLITWSNQVKQALQGK